MKRGQPMGFGRLPDQAHTRFFRRPSAFPVIAAEAGRNDVVPALLPTGSHVYDVIERQIFGWEFLPTVLTRIVIARVDIGPRKLHAIMVLDAHVLEEPNDGGKLDGKRNGVDFVFVLFNDLHFTGKE